ncbi:MAG: GNAT family N-acetyltransferase [Pseudonocardiaceae bacterium]
MSADDRVGPPPLPTLPQPWSVRIAHGEGDLALIHRWMSAPHVEEFWYQHWPLERWRAELDAQLAGARSLPCLVAHDDADLAYIEVYRVLRDRLAGHYPHEPHDLGVHIAIGELDRTGRGLGRALLRALALGLLAADSDCDHVVAEPDASNAPSISAFRAAGFIPTSEVSLSDKTATLMIYHRRTVQ